LSQSGHGDFIQRKRSEPSRRSTQYSVKEQHVKVDGSGHPPALVAKPFGILPADTGRGRGDLRI
jgi:hypothetical protein